ncbi:MAG: sulfite exporter TauE/SafE family protein [Candidatus Paceibacterota bacterium]
MFEVIILILAGFGAGVVTGLAGVSAVVIAAPLLIVFLEYPPYLAIGIALSIDVFSSFSATLIFYKNQKIRIRPTMILLVSALLAVLIGSCLSRGTPSDILSLASGLGILLSGIFMILKKEKGLSLKEKFPFLKDHKIISLILGGLFIGTIAGVFGAGGGLMILFVLVIIMDYKIHEAVGTSVFLMIFIAFLGGFAHYLNAPFSFSLLAFGALGGILGAVISSIFANSLSEGALNKILGTAIAVLGTLLVAKTLF